MVLAAICAEAPGKLYGGPRDELMLTPDWLACVQALVAQLSVEAFHPSVLRRFAGLNVNPVDLPIDSPGSRILRFDQRDAMRTDFSGPLYTKCGAVSPKDNPRFGSNSA